jgi:hypothetical protein
MAQLPARKTHLVDFEMMKDKINIKYDDRQDKMNDKCYKPSTLSARRTASA